ncbi:MAG: hypothetical protein CME62_13670 [Halobacteriovoraceae bacterium]|nr:hypothetical protein [Halobacteriovoraceae bacterium]|tara:strand:+ start:2045 stop:2488 length:444 start_codon:yes stop_codon:yes gene_type:complete
MKHIVVCYNFEENTLNALSKLSNYFSYADTKVTLLHVWNKDAYNYPGDMIVAFYPNEKQAKDIESKMKEQLDQLYDKFPQLPKEQFATEVVSSSRPKHQVVEYLKEVNADALVCLTPKKDKLVDVFHSSFTNYMTGHVHCDVIAIRT